MLVGGSELLVFFCVEDAVRGGGSQPLGAIEVEWRVVPGLDHQITGHDFARAGLGYVVAVRGAVEPISGFLCLLNSKAESNRKKGKGRAQITARRTESRTKRARHRKNSNTPKSNRKKAKCSHKYQREARKAERRGRSTEKTATRQKATEKRQRARTNNSEKHGKQNEEGEAQKKQQQHAKNNGSNGRSEQGRMWRENDKTKERRTTKRTKMMAG